ncbi:putative magnesium transporter [Psidium guajava]|nr:putative magnesium transporter [Psidium guajava]
MAAMAASGARAAMAEAALPVAGQPKTKARAREAMASANSKALVPLLVVTLNLMKDWSSPPSPASLTEPIGSSRTTPTTAMNGP